ncbi:hypothetical protein GCM10028801_10990 [Nocardioides maradonensis]
MGSDDEFGPDTLTIRAWLDKRATYAADREVPLPPINLPSAAAPAVADAPVEPEPPAPTPRMPDTREAGRSVLDVLGPVAREPEAVAPEAAPEAEPDVEPAPAAPEAPRPAWPPTSPARPVDAVPDTAEPPATYTEEPEDDLPPAVIEFKPRTQVRRALTVVLLVALLAAVAVGVVAARQHTTGLYAVAASLGVLVLVVWAVRASTIPTRLTIRRNQLEVVRSGRRTTIDLASPFTPVAILGTPGRRGWQVLIEQLEAPVLTLTASDVDPDPFMRVLLRIRPDLRPEAQQPT